MKHNVIVDDPNDEDLEPNKPDLARCQTETIAYNAFVMGGPTKQVERCPNKPTWVGTEVTPDKKGRRGQMSMCDDCRDIFLKDGPPGYATFEALP